LLLLGVICSIWVFLIPGCHFVFPDSSLRWAPRGKSSSKGEVLLFFRPAKGGGQNRVSICSFWGSFVQYRAGQNSIKIPSRFHQDSINFPSTFRVYSILSSIFDSLKDFFNRSTFCIFLAQKNLSKIFRAQKKTVLKIFRVREKFFSKKFQTRKILLKYI
jgi:hypothetical protein